jgi:benzoyl-CoA 2,3-epoxidase subunit B
MDFRFALPSRRFHRQIGTYAGLHFTPTGEPLSEADWQRRKGEWLPSAEDKAYVKGLQARPVYERGQIANWVAPPPKGINGQPFDFEYVRAEG